MPDTIQNNPCKRCKGVAGTGLECVKCHTVSHRSCVKLMKYVRVMGEDKIDCCSDEGTTDSASVTADLSNSTQLELELKYLKELLKQKDLVIEYQATAISALKDQIDLLKKQSANLESSKKGPSVQGQAANHGNLNKQGQQAHNKQTDSKKASIAVVTKSAVSGALHNAVTQKICSDIVNLEKGPSGTETKLLKQNKKPVRGQLSDTSRCKLQVAESRVNFHVTKLHPATKPVDVEHYLSSMMNNVQVEKITSKYPESYASFKATVSDCDVEKILDPSIWPSGVLVNRFFSKRPVNRESK